MSRVILFFFIFPLLCYGNPYPKDPTYFQLDLEELKKNYKTEEVSTFNFYSRRVESYVGFDFNQILKDRYGKSWDKGVAYAVVAQDKYESFIELYKFTERKAVLAFARKDQKSFSSILSNTYRVVELGPLHLVWKEKYGRKKENRAAKRKHHWPYRIIGVRKINKIPESVRPKTKSDVHKWGYKNFFKQCIHCHQINGFGGRKSFDLTKDTSWRKKGKKWLFKFIDNPKAFNPKIHMTNFPPLIDLREERIKNIVEYLYDVTDPNKTREGEALKRSNKRSEKLKNLFDTSQFGKD